jgi:hypothetical protein
MKIGNWLPEDCLFVASTRFGDESASFFGNFCLIFEDAYYCHFFVTDFVNQHKLNPQYAAACHTHTGLSFI